MQQSPLYPHLWVKEAFPFLWFFWFAWLDFGGSDSGIGFIIDNLLPSFWIWFRVRIFLWPGSFHLNHQWLLGAGFFSVVPRDFMVFTPFSRILLRLLITLLVLRLGLVVLRVAIFTLSPAVWTGATFYLLWLWGVCKSKIAPLLLKFLPDLDSISIRCTQWDDVQKLQFYLNVFMQKTMVFEHQFSLWVFDAQFGL